MRNLKKILALVLALVMVVGLMATASAATPGTGYGDDADITKFDESIQILTALGIYEGDGTNFNPNATITRAEVATLIYRVVTQDTTGKYVGIYSDYNQFADVDSSAWYAGYVNFCANGGYLKGDGTNFYPMEKVTGYQVLAILLRVIGYGMEGEYEGTNWHIRTATKAAELDITKYITAGTLGAYSTRAMVAEMIYRAIAQTETVTYNRVNLYTKGADTYAYKNFGLKGDNGTQKTNNPAVADQKYGEPVSYWLWNGGTIAIRYNPVATYTTTVTGATLYAAAGLGSKNPAVEYYTVDGVAKGIPALTAKGTDKYAGKGVETIVFVADSQEFIVVKQTYVAKVAVEWNYNKDYKVTLTSELGSYTDVDADGLTAGLAKGTVVLYNQYKGTIDLASVHAAPVKAAQTVTNTYVPNAADNTTAYFKVGTAEYEYSHLYGYTYTSDALLDREYLVPNKQTVQDLYFDDYGFVIYTEPTDNSTTNETGYVIIRHGAYGGNIADNRWVGNFTVITENGTQTTIRGALNAEGYYASQAAASDAQAAALGMYRYEIKNGYYALTRIDAALEAPAGDTVVATSVVYPGVANSLGGHLIDNNTVFVIANYDASGAISGYSVATGFKTIPVMTGTMTVEYTYNKDGIAEFVFIQGAAQTAQPVNTAIVDTCFYLVDTTPEKQFNTFDRHEVIMGGKLTVLDFAKGYVSAAGLTNNFYYVSQLTNGLVSGATLAPNLLSDICIPADGVLKCTSVAQGPNTYYALADNCVIYNITNSGVEVIETKDYENIAGVSGFGAAIDVYGYVTVLYVLNADV